MNKIDWQKVLTQVVIAALTAILAAISTTQLVPTPEVKVEVHAESGVAPTVKILK